ncbi:MAG: zinc ribbon domain-containing protein [Verrucomicrobiota bacterium]
MSRFFTCPVCGESVETGSPSCPECGADERTGWNEDTAYLDGIDLPDEAFDETDGCINKGGVYGDWPAKRLVVGIIAAITIIIFALTFVL